LKKKIEGESEEGEKVIWREEIGKYGGVFIGENGIIGYKTINVVKKTCRLNVEKLTTVQKTFVRELRPPANMRELTRAQASDV